MTSFALSVRREIELCRAASAGALAAAEILASSLRSGGRASEFYSRHDGTAIVALEGAVAVAREFGTRTVAARPVLGPALRANRARMTEAVARAVTRAIAGGRA